jgi:hypothetical protein
MQVVEFGGLLSLRIFEEIARQNSKGCDIGYALAASYCEGLTAWMHAPSQPLMRSLLSQFQTPTAPRRVSRLFRVRLLSGLPRLADHQAYFGPAI